MLFLTDLNDTSDYMTSADYKERFIAEYSQVSIRALRLESMLDKYDKNALDFTPASPRELLKAQLNVMSEYREILKKRAVIENIELPEVEL